MGYSRLARHSWQNSSPDNDMRFTAKSRKTVNDRGTSCPTVKQLLHLSSVYQETNLVQMLKCPKGAIPPSRWSLAAAKEIMKLRRAIQKLKKGKRK